MKKSMKKYLILLAVVTVVMLTVAFSASAANFTPQCTNPACKGNTVYYIDTDDINTYVEPGCETIGYTRVKCNNCHHFMSGYITEVAPNGHSYEAVYKLSETKDYYEYLEVCQSCKNITQPEPGVKYYKVSFYNPFATNGKDYYVDDCAYINLVDAERYGDEAYTTKLLDSIYVKEGEIAKYQGMCVREADKTFSSYSLVGWVSQEALSLNNGEIKKEIIDTRVISKINFETNDYAHRDLHEYVFGNPSTNKAPLYIVDEKVNDAKYFTVPVEGETVKADYVVYAVFAGNRETHTVTFKNYAGAIEKTVSVIHGFPATYGLKDPERVPNHQVYYTFDGYWTWFDGFEEHKIDLNNIYKSITVSPHFTMHSNTYLLKYFDKDGKEYVDKNGVALQEQVAIAGPDKDTYAPFKGRSIDVKSYFDNYNLYTYTGLWTMSNRNGSTTINIYDVDLPANVLSYQETDGYIALKPYFSTNPRYYSMPIQISYPDDNNNHPEEIDVQIVSAEGSTRRIQLTADDIVNKKAVESGREPARYHYVVQGMRYSDVYRITATSRTYQGLADRVVFLTGDPNKMEDDGFSEVKITLEHLKQKDCNCLCHTIFKPIWVAALNLLNTLFRVEYVCCDDMFANIGDQLNYGK